MTTSFFFPGDGRTAGDIAAHYAAENARLASTHKPSEDDWANFHVGNLMIHDRRDEAWEILLLAVEIVDDEATLDLIGAGHLEDFVGNHGPQYIDRIEQAARTSERFRRALRGVWAFDSPVRPRVDAILGE